MEKGVIIAENVDIFYGSKKVINDANINIEKGKIYGLMGPSGCGKTTLVKVISGIHSNYRGELNVLGSSVPSIKTLNEIGYMAQKTAIYENITGYENLKFFGSLYSINKNELRKRIEEIAKLVRLDGELEKIVSKYSEGMKQRLALAIALIAEPKVLILDEPTVGIDPILKAEIWDELNSLSKIKGVTILITTHIMDEADRCDGIAIMREGEILIQGSPSDIKRRFNSSNLEEVFVKIVGGDYENTRIG